MKVVTIMETFVLTVQLRYTDQFINSNIIIIVIFTTLKCNLMVV